VIESKNRAEAELAEMQQNLLMEKEKLQMEEAKNKQLIAQAVNSYSLTNNLMYYDITNKLSFLSCYST